MDANFEAPKLEGDLDDVTYPTKDGFDTAEEQEYFVCWELQRLTHCLNPHAKRNNRIAIISYFLCLGVAIFMIVIAIVAAIIMDDLNSKMETANSNMMYMYEYSNAHWLKLIAGGQLVQLNNFWICEFFVMSVNPNLQGWLWENRELPWPKGIWDGKRWPCCPVEAEKSFPGGCENLFLEVRKQWNVQNA